MFARVLETFGGVTLVAALAFGLGFWVSFQVSHSGCSASRLRRRYALGVRILTVLSLVVYGWIIHSVGWSKMVRTNWGLGGLILVDDFVVFLPYLSIQLLVWWGLFIAERALQIRHGPNSASRLGCYMILKARQSLGLILPVILLYVIRRDVLARYFPGWDRTRWPSRSRSPCWGHSSWRSRPSSSDWPGRLAPCPRVRCAAGSTRIADRVGFRFTDVLVWDTGNMMVNACVTGILPGFRYVLLTDALIESLTPHRNRGGFRTRDRPYRPPPSPLLRLFLHGELGRALGAGRDGRHGVVRGSSSWPGSLRGLRRSLAKSSRAIAAPGCSWACISGSSSGSFPGDSSGRPMCSAARWFPAIWRIARRTHDLDHDLSHRPVRGKEPMLCPVGIRIFADALANVARCQRTGPRRPIVAARQHRPPDRIPRRARAPSRAGDVSFSAV